MSLLLAVLPCESSTGPFTTPSVLLCDSHCARHRERCLRRRSLSLRGCGLGAGQETGVTGAVTALCVCVREVLWVQTSQKPSVEDPGKSDFS